MKPRAFSEIGQMRAAGAVGAAESGNRLAAHQRCMKIALGDRGFREHIGLDLVGARQQVVDVPVSALFAAQMAIDALPQAATG